MSILNAILRPLFGALVFPFRELPVLVGLTVVSLVVAVVMLLAFKYTSNQEMLERVKRQIHAGLFEIRLFNDDFRAILRAQSAILRHNLTYLRYAMVPIVWTLIPLVFILAHLQPFFGYSGLEPGEPTLLEVSLEGEQWDRPQVTLTAPEGIEVEAGPVWAPPLGELSWRIAAAEPGNYDLEIEIDGETYTKTVTVSDALVRRSPMRPTALLDQLLYPAEPPLPSKGPVTKIEIRYPPGDGGIGMPSEITWIVVLLVLSLVFGFALRKPLGVTF